MHKTEIYEVLDRAYFSADSHEKEVIEHLPTLLKGKTLAVDAGASLGQYTRAMSRIMRDGEIHAIEADPIRVERLEANCNDWQKTSSNKLVAHHLALTDKSGVVPYYVTNSDISGGLTPHGTSRAVEWEEIAMPASTLDDLFAGRRPDFVKIDVEGAELSVLHGADRILADADVTFLIEMHDWPPGAGVSNEVRIFMKSAGYRSASFFGRAVFVKSRRRWLALKLMEMRDARRLLRRLRRRLRRARG